MRTTTTFEQSSARHFEFVHGRAPRGTGWWSFTMHRSGSSTQFQASGSFSDVRRQAMREARSLGCDTVTVDT